jgi:hypothetical protein
VADVNHACASKQRNARRDARRDNCWSNRDGECPVLSISVAAFDHLSAVAALSIVAADTNVSIISTHANVSVVARSDVSVVTVRSTLSILANADVSVVSAITDLSVVAARAIVIAIRLVVVLHITAVANPPGFVTVSVFERFAAFSRLGAL